VTAALPEPVRRLAVHPMTELELPPGFERVARDGFTVLLSPFPTGHVADAQGLRPEQVEAAVLEARELARPRGTAPVIWWVAPEADAIAEPLERLGLRNEDSPGYEAIENAMALVQPPAATSGDDIVVRPVQTLEEYREATDVSCVAFDVPAAMRAEMAAAADDRYAELCLPGYPGSCFVALAGGRVVGSAMASFAGAGVNLFAAAVHPDARGRGVYRALTLARWQLAVERGTPALTIQAGRMSRPIVERLGFTLVAQIRLYPDPTPTD
jgi:GNAT superfamily N-acetyltransferase